MPHTHKVIITQSNNIKDQFRCVLQNVIALSQFESIEEVVLDFSNFRFAPPMLSVFFASLIDNCKGSSNVAGLSYLNTIKFPDGLSCENGTCSVELNRYQGRTYLPLVRLSLQGGKTLVEDRNALISNVFRLIREQTKVPANVFNAIAYLIDEPTCNIIDHSRANHGWLSAQYYQGGDYLDICIADSGRGLLNSYREYDGEKNFSYITTHKGAIEAALKGMSTKHLIERGFGIHTSKRLLEQGLKGDYILLTGDAFSINDSVASIEGVHQGTLVFMRLPVVNDPNFNIHAYVD